MHEVRRPAGFFLAAGRLFLAAGRAASDLGRAGPLRNTEHRDGWRAFRSHLGTGRVVVYDAELWAIVLALQESVKRKNTLQTHEVTKVAVFRDSQAAI
jgi:hypothetical protein